MVYFILCGEYVKIGVAVDVERRLRHLQMSNPHPLELIATMDGERDLERQLHCRFVRYHARGEWYRYGPRLQAYVAKHATLLPARPRPVRRRRGRVTDEMATEIALQFDI